jgi:hypothetical protein
LVIILRGVVASLVAQETNSKNYTYSTANRVKQTAQEVQDIGEFKEEEQQGFKTFRDKLRFNVNLRSGYTTNALLDGNHSSSDFLILPTVEVGFHTPLGEHFSFDLATRVESVTYAKYDERGFAGYSANATLDYKIRNGLPRFYASIEPYRYDSYDTGDLISEAIGFTGGTDWGFAFNGGRSLGFVGYSFTDYLADPSMDSRLVNKAVVGLAHQFRPNLTGQIYYLFQYSDYTDFDRHDSKHTLAGTLIYQISDHWFGNLTTSYVDNDSTQQHASYESFGATLGVTLQF